MNSTETEQEVEISFACAAVLTTCGTAFGATFGYFFTPLVVAAFGFSSTGVTAGSAAAAWQSLLVTVEAGSIFARLQALAMAGQGLGTVAITSGVLGGALAAARISKFCADIDEATPESATGRLRDFSVSALTKILVTKDAVKDTFRRRAS